MAHTRHHLVAIAFAFLVVAGIARGNSVTITNAGFEVRETYDPFPDGTDKYVQYLQETWRHFDCDNNGGPLRTWNPADPADANHLVQGNCHVGFGGNAPEGKYVVAVYTRFNDNEFYLPPNTNRDFEAVVQLLSKPFNPRMKYTLSADVGRLPGCVHLPGNTNWYGYALMLAAGGTNVGGSSYAGYVTGGTVVAQDWNTITVPVDTFVRAVATYMPNPNLPNTELEGLPLQIRLAALEFPEDHSITCWAAFDNVTLEEEPAFNGSLLMVR